MIRTAIILLALASPAAADGAADYVTELEAGLVEYITEREMQEVFTQPGVVYNASLLDSEGLLVMTSRDGSDTVIQPELIAVFDHATFECTWGFERDDFPRLPRTAALAVKREADARGWPEDAVATNTTSLALCGLRSNLASTLGELSLVYKIWGADQTVFLGFPSNVEPTS
ncbi:hypothetical protein [Octadecabacter sp. R77987]|uniref:hypothetical protein n=1 Tax=Octadecabacter sp. R77987 TaxID=3093874 RepID=UPI0036721920